MQVWVFWLSSIYIYSLDIPILLKNDDPFILFKFSTKKDSRCANQQSHDYQADSYENQPKNSAHRDRVMKEGNDEHPIPKNGKSDGGQCTICLDAPQIDASHR